MEAFKMYWKKKMFKCELQKATINILKLKDSTAVEICAELKRVNKVDIKYHALTSILEVTKYIYIKGLTYSEVSDKMVNVYATRL
jgi:hypothetical protein